MATTFPTTYATMVTDTGWQTINGDKYYIKDSQIVEGLQEINGATYYFDEDGKMMTGVQMTPDERYFGEDGKQQMGIQEKNGNYILYTGEGRANRGWHEFNEKKYFVTEQRVLATGLQKLDGETYYFAKTGELQTGWQETPEKRYFDKDGKMLTGSQTIDGQGYYFNDDGTLMSGFIANRYYNEDGTVFVGKKTIGALTIETDSEGEVISKTTTTGQQVVETARNTGAGDEFIQKVYEQFGVKYDKDGKQTTAGDYTADGVAGDIVVYKDKDNYRVDAGVYLGNGKMIDAQTGDEVTITKDESVFVGFYRHDFLKKDLTTYDKY